ncbi:MAG TPA: molybdopterin cofactor-binding domain-containing protein [Phnomibacter sp.]|nr:molybdopterin cofactor-binding domain-containing protein [Phnomibacter sp.]
MKEADLTAPHWDEPFADELPDRAGYKFQLDRRKFFGLAGGGLAVVLLWKNLPAFAGVDDEFSPTLPVTQVGAWIHITEEGRVQVYTGKVEVGQNIRTSLSQAVAEELRVGVEMVDMIMGDTDRVPYDAGTFGSRTTPQMSMQLRKAATVARNGLLQLAGKKWGVPHQDLQAADGYVMDPSVRRKIAYGELTKGEQMLLTISDDIKMTDAAQWKVSGKSIPKVNGVSFITGQHKYVSDMKLPAMLYGKVLRPPTIGARLVSVDTTEAAALPGVVVVHDGNFAGVAAPDIKLAEKALRALKAQWDEKPSAASHHNIFSHLKETTSGGNAARRNAGTAAGDIEQGLKQAAVNLQKTFTIQYIAHVPLEPRAAVAQWEADGKLRVWTGTQRPFGVQDELANAFRTAKEKVRVEMPDTGSGYGGKHSGETAIEAARLAQKAGKPVKVVWTREEEFWWAYFRPAGVMEVQAGADKDGKLTAWQFYNYNSGGAGLATPYKVAHQDVKHIPSNSPLRQGSYRGLAIVANLFARESAISDLARRLKMDELAFRLKNLEDERLQAVLRAAAEAFGWQSRQAQPGEGFGMACGYEKGGYVGTCAEVRVNEHKEVRIVRVVQAFECGAIIHPRHLESQVMGCVVQGIGGALFEAIEFSQGKILNGTLSAYRVPRFSDIPDIKIILMDRKDLPSAGAGEAAILGVAPAIRNAIAHATGIELTSLPLIPNGVLEKK